MEEVYASAESVLVWISQKESTGYRSNGEMENVACLRRLLQDFVFLQLWSDFSKRGHEHTHSLNLTAPWDDFS